MTLSACPALRLMRAGIPLRALQWSPQRCEPIDADGFFGPWGVCYTAVPEAALSLEAATKPKKGTGRGV
jgi:hypothetical protein